MNRSEVIELLKKIKRRYPVFQLPNEHDKLSAMVLEWLEDLSPVPFEVAVENLKRHASTEDWPPSIAKLSQPLQTESDLEIQQMRDAAKVIIAEQDEWDADAVPPPDEIRAIFQLPVGEREGALRDYVARKQLRNGQLQPNGN